MRKMRSFRLPLEIDAALSLASERRGLSKTQIVEEALKVEIPDEIEEAIREIQNRLTDRIADCGTVLNTTYSVSEVANILGVAPATVYGWLPDIGHVRVGPSIGRRCGVRIPRRTVLGLIRPVGGKTAEQVLEGLENGRDGE